MRPRLDSFIKTTNFFLYRMKRRIHFNQKYHKKLQVIQFHKETVIKIRFKRKMPNQFGRGELHLPTELFSIFQQQCKRKMNKNNKGKQTNIEQYRFYLFIIIV